MITWRKPFSAVLAAALLPLVAWAGLTTQTVRAVASGTDTTPNAFSFTDQTDVAVSSTITSTAVTITGINSSTLCSATNGTLDKNSSDTFASTQNVVNNDTIRARHTSSASNSTAVNTLVDCGSVMDTFTSTTEAGAGGDWADVFVAVSGAPAELATNSRIVGIDGASVNDWAPNITFPASGCVITREAGGAYDGASVLFVADRDNGRLQRFDLTGPTPPG